MKIITRDEFGELLITSLYSYENTNIMLRRLGVKIVPQTIYNYYAPDGQFICNTENFCLDDILEKSNIKIED